MYDVCIYFSAAVDPGFVETTLFQKVNLAVWDKVQHPGKLKSILEIEGLPPVGLCHWYRPANAERQFACYSLAIYPPHYNRALGGLINGVAGVSHERWHELETWRVRSFHEALFQIVLRMKESIPLVAASINTEDRGFARPYVDDGAICVSPNVAEVLGYTSKPLLNSHGYFVSIGHPLSEN